MKIKYRGKTLNIAVRKTSFFSRLSGMMFRTSQTHNLYFEFPKSEPSAIHSLFVFFPFMAIWLDDDHNVIDVQIVKPFTFLVKPKKPSRKLIEIPFNCKSEKIIKIFVDKGKI